MFKNRKMMRISLLLVGLLLVAGSSAFIVRNAAAGSCFTDVADGSFWYSVTCWMKNKGISTGYADGSYRPDATVSRGEMGFFVQRAFSNTSQVAYLTTGPTAWTANDATDGFVQTYWGWSHLHKSTAGTAQFNLSPTIPTSLYNTLMYGKGVKICYDADAAAYITNLSIKHLWYTSSGYTEINTVTDATDRTGVGCTTLYFASPQGMWGSDQITILLDVTFTGSVTPLYMGTTSVIIYPSTFLSALGLDETEAALLGRGEFNVAEFDPSSGLEP